MIRMPDFPAEPAAVSRLDAIDAVLAQITSGESPAAIRRGLVPEAWTPMLSRVAVAGRFDQGIYDRMLTAAGPADPPALSVLADAGLITPVPGRPGWFTMPSQDREIWAADLQDPELAALETGLAEAHLDRKDRLEGMQHLLTGDPERGRDLLESLLSEADAQLNLPRYQDILQAAKESQSSIGADLADFIASHTAYLNARSMWLTDYYQSAHFLAPPGFLEQGRGFTAAGSPRVWHIVGPGGTGKTMQLRWLVSRLWVPQPARTPCARIDFDTIDPMACARYPFLVFIMLADQLAQQLPLNPFSRLLRSYQPFLGFATRGAGQEEAPSATQAAQAGREVPQLFAEGCKGVGGTPVVIILDTLEELSLRYPAATETLVGQFREVYNAIEGLRLVFAGRYEIPAVGRDFEWVSPHQVAPFSADQADTYLEQIRGIADEGRRAEIIQRAGGLPYVLAMYADLVTANPAVPLDDIDQDLEPRLVYLAERIIDRIPEPLVRWLLRYGWVPRRLTRGYVRDVLAPFVIQAGSGDRTLDDPLLDPITEWRGRRLFPTDLPDLQAELDRAWDDLNAYKSDSAWVTGVPGDPDTVLLKAEMLAPMRAFLADRPILRQLHQRSADFYCDLAPTYPDRSSLFFREAIFHLAQAGSPDLVARWQEYVDQAREAGDYDTLADLSAEVTGSEYVDDAGTPLHRGPDEIVPADLVIEARLWRAYAAQAQLIARLGDGIFLDWQNDPLWVDIRRELEAAAALARPTLRAWVAESPGERRLLLVRADRLVGAALAVAEGDPWRAWNTAGELRDTDDDIALCAAQLRVAIAPLTGEDIIPELEMVTRRALDADRGADATASASMLAAHLVSVGNLERYVVNRTDSLADTYLSLLTERGTPAAALGWPSHRDLPLEASFAVDWNLAKAYLALRQPEMALQLLLVSEERLGELSDPAARLRERASCLEMKGIAYGTLLRLDEAAAAFEQSASLWQDLGHPHGHLRSRRHHAEILLREAGDVTEALTLLAGLSAQLDDGEESAAVQRLTAEALALNGPPEAAMPVIERLLDQTAPGHHRRRALAAVAALVATQDVDRFGPLLHDSLIHVRPPSARLVVLQELRWCPPLPAHPVLEALASQATTAGQSVLPGDAAVHRLQQAFVAHACGDPDVRPLLAAALAGARSGFLACEILRHFPGDAPDQAAAAAEEYLRADQAQAKTLAAMVHLRLAERLWHRLAPPGAVEPLIRLTEAELETAGRPSHWLAGFYELRGRIALSRGDVADATLVFQSAEALQQRLGNVAGIDAIKARLATADGEGGELVPAAAPEPARELVVRYLPLGPPGATAGLGADVGAMRSALELARDDSPEPLLPGGVVRVESPEPEVLGQPWELVTDRIYRAQPPVSSQKRDTAWLRWVLGKQAGWLAPDLQQRCLRIVSGQEMLTPPVREQVELALERADHKRRVVIIKGSEQAEASWEYAPTARGLNVKSSYLSAGWDVDELTTAQIRQAGLRSLLTRRPPRRHPPERAYGDERDPELVRHLRRGPARARPSQGVRGGHRHLHHRRHRLARGDEPVVRRDRPAAGRRPRPRGRTVLHRDRRPADRA